MTNLQKALGRFIFAFSNQASLGTQTEKADEVVAAIREIVKEEMIAHRVLVRADD